MKKDIALMKEILVTLHETAGIGWHAIRKAFDVGDWIAYPRYEAEAWLTVGFRPEQAKAAAAMFRSVDFDQRREQMNRLGISVLTPLDSEYPHLLKQIPQPPWVLYAIGRTELLQGPSIAVVGTRGPTAYGRKAALDLSYGLAAKGLVISSGMALGIDRIAHEGALKASKATIAVLGTPVDVIYPPQNRDIYADIRENGLILSELPLGRPFHPGHFPLRNRIIAGISIGTLVIEAAERSGSLITANQALDMNREVFAVPGTISSPKSAGTNKLIREHGAKLVTDAEHIIEEFGWLVESLAERAVRLTPDKEQQAAENMTEEETFIYDLLQDQPRTTDELHELSRYPFGLLHAVLINLSIKRKIEQHPGSLYSVT
ncbi:DNA processing protein [Paenibacillus phyllosphaerae]|uniref:DNA processing protein n=1 Tax=Paenibacillus phyllosphaerae TaxID=274593 RepID=A0A7W5FLW0_9BACL|nr:DNA-processing protein DprA [Paenibacillus phyllosphaerae]MBB3109379.1 DNA processing protein [Paenibacillus phyllosphaerae]